MKIYNFQGTFFDFLKNYQTFVGFQNFWEFNQIFHENLDNFLENSFYVLIAGFGTEHSHG